MKKKFLATLFIFSVLFMNTSYIFAENTAPEPYNTEEFPQTLKDLRRFEIISLGSLPFITLDVTIAYSLINWYKAGASMQNGPNLLAVNTYSQEEQLKILKTSMYISLGVGVTDLTYRIAKRHIDKNKTKKQNKSVLVIPLDEDPDAIKLDVPGEDEE